jgi:hypothetical protein
MLRVLAARKDLQHIRVSVRTVNTIRHCVSETTPFLDQLRVEEVLRCRREACARNGEKTPGDDVLVLWLQYLRSRGERYVDCPFDRSLVANFTAGKAVQQNSLLRLLVNTALHAAK